MDLPRARACPSLCVPQLYCKALFGTGIRMCCSPSTAGGMPRWVLAAAACGDLVRKHRCLTAASHNGVAGNAGAHLWLTSGGLDMYGGSSMHGVTQGVIFPTSTPTGNLRTRGALHNGGGCRPWWSSIRTASSSARVQQDDSAQQAALLAHLTDMRHPATWYPAARAFRRK
jgi:hypothetical protein